MLLLKLMQLWASFGWSLSNLLTYCDLWTWLDDPYNVAAAEPAPSTFLLFTK